jgi:putative ABC transport system substrate-binding protein
MQRRQFITLLGGAAAGWPIAGIAEQSNRVRRIGGLLLTGFGPFTDAFVLELQKLGWIEDRNIHIEMRIHTGGVDEIRSLAADLVRRSPDVILATSPIEAKVLRQETSTIPIVFVIGVDPVSQGIVDSFAHPGGNITGCSSYEFSMGGKWVQSLTEIAPAVKRIGIIFNPQTAPYMQSIVHSVEVAAAPLRVKISAMPVHDLVGVAHAVASLAEESDSGIILPPDLFLAANIQAIVALVAQYRLPTMYSAAPFARLGGLIAYGPDLSDNWRRAANLVDRILKGAKPADLPIEQPDKFELVINLKTAKALGLTVPSMLLAQATEVIE